MKSSVRVERLSARRDARGWIVEPLRPAEIPEQRNVHLVVSEPGAVRGNHYHLRGTEHLTVVGPALVRLREEGETRDLEVPAGEILRLVIPPGVAHAIRNTGDAPGVMIGFNSVEHDPAAPDLVREVLIDP